MEKELVVEVDLNSYDKETYVKFQQFVMLTSYGRRSRTSGIISKIIGISIFSSFVLVTVVCGILLKDSGYFFVSGAMVFILLLSQSVYFFPNFSYKQFAKQISPDFHITYQFYSDHFIENITGSKASSNNMISYELVNKVFETSTAFYIQRLQKNIFHIIPKKEITPSQVQCLSELFKNTFGKKYKKYK